MKKLLFGTFAACVLSMSANAAVIADWTFETTVPTTGGPISADIGTGTATSNTGGTFTNPVGNGSTESWSSNGWASGEYFQFQVSTVGLEDITISWDQTGSNTGPRNFDLRYSTDGVSFTTFSSYTLTNDNWSGVTYNPVSTHTADLSAITALDNDTSIFFRFVDTSSTSITGGTVQAAGSSRIDNVVISGVPEPTTAGMLLGGLGLMVWTLRKRRAGA